MEAPLRTHFTTSPFIESSIAKHQAFLDNMDQIEEFQQKEKKRQEQALIDKGIAEGATKQLALLIKQGIILWIKL